MVVEAMLDLPGCVKRGLHGKKFRVYKIVNKKYYILTNLTWIPLLRL